MGTKMSWERCQGQLLPDYLYPLLRYTGRGPPPRGNLRTLVRPAIVTWLPSGPGLPARGVCATYYYYYSSILLAPNTLIFTRIFSNEMKCKNYSIFHCTHSWILIDWCEVISPVDRQHCYISQTVIKLITNLDIWFLGPASPPRRPFQSFWGDCVSSPSIREISWSVERIGPIEWADGWDKGVSKFYLTGGVIVTGRNLFYVNKTESWIKLVCFVCRNEILIVTGRNLF